MIRSSMRNDATMWFVLLWLLLVTAAVAVFASPLACAIATSLLAVAFAGTLRRKTWGISAAAAFSWIALLSCFALSLGDPENPLSALAERLLHRQASLAELYAGVALATAPWVLCLHLLGLQKARLRASRP
jgi:hypothetical protein